MARPKSQDKRKVIPGRRDPTSEKSKRAGVAEGTLFTYFETKDDLINALYRAIKLELALAMMSGFPRKKSVLTISGLLPELGEPCAAQGAGRTAGFGDAFERVIEAGGAPFVEMQNMIRDPIDQHILRVDVPREMISKTLVAEAEGQLWQTSIATVDLRSTGRGSRGDILHPMDE